MHATTRSHLLACEGCRNAEPLPFAFTMAFQPIVDVEERRVYAYEALVRGVNGSSAASILEQVTVHNRYRFDQECRATAVELAARLDLDCRVSINIMPNAMYDAATCIRATLAAARRFDFPVERIMFEVSEQEQVEETGHVDSILEHYRERGFVTAIDDFGAGFAGLSLLVEFQPHVVKIDMGLLRGISEDPVRQVVVRGVIDVCRNLDIDMVAEGVETTAEYGWLRAEGVRYFQGYLFARPELEALPEISWPE